MEDNTSVIELAGEDLFNFAVDREDIKTLIAHLPEETVCEPEAIEYELQLLKIISVGWSISFLKITLTGVSLLKFSGNRYMNFQRNCPRLLNL